MSVTADSSIRLCAEPQTDRQEIVVWGVKHTTTVTFPPVTDERYNAGAAASSAGGANTTSFSPANNVTGAPDGNTANVDLLTTTTTAAQASITASSYNPSAIPNNATITGVKARILHEEDPLAGGQNNDLAGNNFRFTVTSGSTSTSTGFSVKQNALGADTFALSPADFDTAAKRSNATVTVTVREDTASGRGNERRVRAKIDAIQLTFDYTTPPIIGLTGEEGTCVETGSTCPLISTSGTNAQDLYLTGTTYAPLAMLDIQLTNQADQAFARGVVARTIIANITASSGFTGSVFSLPDLNSISGPGVRKVTLTVTINGNVIGTAVVRFDSPSPGDVKVLSWNLKHCGKNEC